MTDQSIEDASHNSIIEDARQAGFVIDQKDGFFCTGSMKDLTKFAQLREARQSSQSEPVAFAWYREGNAINPHHVEHINVKGETVYIDFRMSTPPTNKGWIPLFLAAPQQAIPSGMMLIDIDIVDDVLNKAYCECGESRRFDKGEHLSSCALFDLNIERNKLSASPTAPIERDK
jgi:hypothetical protein